MEMQTQRPAAKFLQSSRNGLPGLRTPRTRRC